MSASGTKRTSPYARPMPAFGGKADIAAKLLSRDEARRIACNIAKLWSVEEAARFVVRDRVGRHSLRGLQYSRSSFP
jgi:hypothetical protein